MRRRAFITLLGGAAAWPLGARAQQARKLPTIGFLGESHASGPERADRRFRAATTRTRWIEGRTVAIEYRWTEGRDERFAELWPSSSGSRSMSFSPVKARRSEVFAKDGVRASPIAPRPASRPCLGSGRGAGDA
jgi:hypothetical protein